MLRDSLGGLAIGLAQNVRAIDPCGVAGPRQKLRGTGRSDSKHLGQHDSIGLCSLPHQVQICCHEKGRLSKCARQHR